MKRRPPVFTITALGALLAIGFFPLMFDRITYWDDEGFFLTTMRQFLHHGSLYAHVRTSYGPFYFSAVGFLYRVTGQEPTLFNGRLITLALTALAAAMFAATVWRVTKSLAFSAVCEVATFCVLINVAGNEPMHPGSLIVLLLSVLAYALAGYAMDQQPRYLAIAGAMLGALLMTKINVGVFALVALCVSFAIGNRLCPKPIRSLVAAGALALPFVLMSQLIWHAWAADFAVIVSFSLLVMFGPLIADAVSIPLRELIAAVWGFGAAVVLSLVWPLLSGTSPVALFEGVLIRPIGQVDNLTRPVTVSFQWVAIVLTVAVVCLALARRGSSESRLLESAAVRNTILAVAALWVFALGLFAGFAAWIPAIAVLPALAWAFAEPPQIRFVLRLLVPLSVLQLLHAYPVAGAQRSWGLVTMCVPTLIVVAAVVERQELWRKTAPGARALAVAFMCVLVALGAGFWPFEVWHSYNDLTAVNLVGARSVRVLPAQAKTLDLLTRVVKQKCDTFYSAPGFDSLYIFTGLPVPTGLLSNWPGVLTTSEQRTLVTQLADLQASGKRVCIVRDLDHASSWLASSYGTGPLGRALAAYQARVARVGNYSVSLMGSGGVGG